MGKIKILSDDVSNRIAAGEVIERPASVVKECVENSIDAGATEIVVKIVNGGRDLIQIIDNGHGMSEEDAFLAFERHATSKISSADDIVHITTMGFRGEALPSIASISHFQIITKTESDSVATEINFSGGRLDSMQKTAAKTGTTITIKNLFYNVPARRKFLKSEAVEYKHIVNYIHYQSVLFPNITFILHNNHKEKFNHPATDSIKNRMLDVFGTSFTKQNFMYLDTAGDSAQAKGKQVIRLSGYLQDIDGYEKNTLLDVHYIYVNRRYIYDKTVYSAIRSAYDPFLKKYRFFNAGKPPNYIFFIDIDPEEIDVNVHPAKTEIRFRNTSAVYQFVKDSIYGCLHNNEVNKHEKTRQKLSSFPLANPLTKAEQMIAQELFKIPTTDTKHQTLDVIHETSDKFSFIDFEKSINTKSTHDTDTQPDSLQHTVETVPALPQSEFSFMDFEKSISSSDIPLCRDSETATTDSQDSQSPPQEAVAVASRGWDAIKNPNELNTKHQYDQHQIIKTMREDFVQLWQLHNTYIFIQTDEGFVAIDQHAAHERIVYEKLLKNIDTKKPNKQKLVFPLVIDLPNFLSESIKDVIEANSEVFDSLGFTVKLFSGNSIVIDEIPSELGFWDGGDVFIEILKQLENELTQTTDFRIASAASVACKASVKAGQKMTKKEMHELIIELFKCEYPFQCPHGRPLIIKVTLNEIEKMFKRIN